MPVVYCTANKTWPDQFYTKNGPDRSSHYDELMQFEQ